MGEVPPKAGTGAGNRFHARTPSPPRDRSFLHLPPQTKFVGEVRPMGGMGGVYRARGFTPKRKEARQGAKTPVLFLATEHRHGRPPRRSSSGPEWMRTGGAPCQSFSSSCPPCAACPEMVVASTNLARTYLPCSILLSEPYRLGPTASSHGERSFASRPIFLSTETESGRAFILRR